MTFEIPDDRRYAESHEWAKKTDAEGVVRIGITDFAQDELGDIVFAELPEVGDELSEGDEFGVIESIKAVSDIYSPVTGTVEDVNGEIIDQPELINDDPHESGWLVAVETESGIDHLLTASEYEEHI
ncbi:glycine cleavage system protein H [Halogeometricum pallidum JCM 14848]|uniref:Probable glycine cleavage system H protein n=1 Tax=Halogeometricum pallidum JCM 14848 TaxID=1227487 RepID=M0D3W3_HALPD|nr:glycine cleavage system protein GcvH [Halogeometricum pallidum]ELZ29382.1 glycine cleavage system protein H [Halogeometricum pallidum JCM 14848]